MKEMQSLSMEKLLEEIRYDQGRYPREALDELIKRREESIPELLKIVELVSVSPGLFTDTPSRFDHIYAVLLLSQFQAADAFAPYLRTLQLPDDTAFTLYGDLLTNCGGRILANLYSGLAVMESDLVSFPELDAIFDLIDDTSLDELIRGVGFQAITALVRQKKISRELIQYYYHDLLQGDLDDESGILYTLLIDSCMELDFRELSDDIMSVFEEKRADGSMIAPDDVEAHFNDGTMLDKEDQYKPITNVHEELDGWYEWGR